MTEILWTCLELLANLFDSFLCIHFIINSFNGKCKVLDLKSTYIIGIVSAAAAVTIFNYITFFEGVLGITYVVLFFAFEIIFLRGALWKKAYISFITVLCLITTASLSGNVLFAIFRDDTFQIYNKLNLERVLFIVIGLAIRAYIFALLTGLTAKKEYYLKRKEWTLILSVLVISFIVIALIHGVLLDPEVSNRFLGTLMAAEFGIIIINILCFYITVNLSETHRREEELIVEKKQIEYGQKYAQDIKEQYEQTRRLRHDIKQYVVTMLSLIRNNKLDAVEELAQKLADDTAKSGTVIKVDNDILNAVLNSKLSYAKSLGIDVFCSVENGITGIEDIDLCNLLGNLLDNAITAAKVCSDEFRLIEVNILTSGNRLIITVKNSIQSSVLNDNPKLKSTKDASKEHGFGIKTIKSIAEKYNGSADFYEENLTFICKIILGKNI